MDRTVRTDRHVAEHPQIVQASVQFRILNRPDGSSEHIDIHHEQLLSR
jgi:hypothetical protein